MPSTTGDPGRITVAVRLYSILRHRDGQVVDRLALELPVGSRVQDLLDELGVDPALEVILAVNAEIAEEETELEEGDLVSLIPAISGGTRHDLSC